MTAIVGLDLSLASTGLARITTTATRSEWVAETTCHTSAPTRSGSSRLLTDRAKRVEDITRAVADWVLPCALAVVEGPSLHSVSNSTVDRAWLWGAVVGRLVAADVPVIEVPPATRSKFVASAGGADKGAVALTVGRMWPDWEPSTSDGVNDQADALALASIGVVLGGLHPPFPMPAYRARALTKLPAVELT